MCRLDIKRWLDINHPAESSASSRLKGEDGIKIATGGAQANTVKIEMTNEAAERAYKEAKREEAEAQRAQNAQPNWFAHSTVATQGRSADGDDATASQAIPLPKEDTQEDAVGDNSQLFACSQIQSFHLIVNC